MRRIFLGSLVAAFLWSSMAFAYEKVEPIPIFMDPEFRFNQIETICLAPALDLRSDKTTPLFLSEQGPGIGFSHTQSANQETAGILKSMGYQTTECNPVSATLNDLKTPLDTWLRNLDFGQTSWLLIFAVEDLRTAYSFWGEASGFAGPQAVVSGFLFERRADAVRLVWRDRAVGTLPEGLLGGRKKTVEAGESAMTVDDGIGRLLAEFERRKGRPRLAFGVVEENFSATCDAVWTALKDTLEGDPKKFKIGVLDGSDKMALYTTHIGGAHEDHVVLKTQGGACAMQITQARYVGKMADEWGELIKRMRASLPKQ
jgi:hypothetical protein